MTYELTASVHKGTCSSAHLGHNRRNITVPHASKDRKDLNVCYIDMDLETAYHKLFDEALEEYNASKKPSRRINDYLKHITEQYEKGEQKLQEAKSRGASRKALAQIKSRYPKVYYELIVSVGNCEVYEGAFKCGGDKEQIVVDILNEYMADFTKRNNHLFVFSAHLHRDEVGVPHIHIDYIPWTDTSGRGLRVRVSENGAFMQQGLTDGNEIGTVAFQSRERKILTEIARNHQVSIIEGRHTKKHLSKAEYILNQNSKMVEQEARELLQQQDSFIDFVQNSSSGIAYLEHLENNELRKTVSEYEILKQRSEKVLSEAWSEFNSATSDFFANYRKKKKILFEEIQRAREDSNHSKRRLKSILNNITYSNDFFIIKMFKLVFALFVAIESQSLEKEVQKLQRKNQELKAQAKQIISDGQSVGDKLRNKDLDMIEKGLNDYEYQLEKSIQIITEIASTKHKKDTCLTR